MSESVQFKAMKARAKKAEAEVSRMEGLIENYADMDVELETAKAEIAALTVQVLQLKALLIANDIDVPDLKPATFLPDCKWQREACNVIYCTDIGCKLFDQPCSKRCDCPEPKEKSK